MGRQRRPAGPPRASLPGPDDRVRGAKVIREAAERSRERLGVSNRTMWRVERARASLSS
ncbi:hypothetical protein ABZY14_33835 [Streptomyces sp. NPDC006617]|uniref:hypothetical protein n=1 Tax=Streptomyces sp. NPDC006617 TaxID=3155354 RepID=UPI0033A032FE